MKRMLYILLPCCITAIYFSLLGQLSVQQELSHAFVRLHVMAASDSLIDQENKIAVKDSVVAFLAPFLCDCENKKASVETINDLLPQIQAVAKSTLIELNDHNKITVALENTVFPQKTYGDITLPAGMYDALKITIGEGEGRNWWCVLFPPLCFQDISTSGINQRAETQIGSLISENAYNVIKPRPAFYFLSFLNFLFE